MDVTDAVYQVVREIPQGRVATYGQVADMVEGWSISAREVGALLNVCPPDVPWQRVVGAGGHLPIGKRSPELKVRQRALLESEGVAFSITIAWIWANSSWIRAPARHQACLVEPTEHGCTLALHRI